MFGRYSRALYAVWSNPAPGVDHDRFRRYYEEVHRPDSLALGQFDRSFRYQAHGACRARFLTLWEAEYPDLASALGGVRKGALALREQGRIWPVQEVVFHQLLFAPKRAAVAEGPVATLTTVQNDWSAPSRGQDVHAWSRAALPAERVLAACYAAQFLYAAPHATDTRAGRFLWIGETDASPAAVSEIWRGSAQAGLAPLGRATPIFPPAEGEPAPEPDAALSDPPDALRAAWVVHWIPVT